MGFKVVPKGIAFGMVEIHADGQKFEHTTFRADKYSAGGAHRPTSIQFSKTPEEDSRRRDFSVNALYCDILTREILDPSGGLPDLENRVSSGVRAEHMSISLTGSPRSVLRTSPPTAKRRQPRAEMRSAMRISDSGKLTEAGRVRTPSAFGLRVDLLSVMIKPSLF